MINIKKQPEPACLLRFKRTNKAQPALVFKDLPSGVKKKIKDTLLTEQGYLCCYCMSRITYDRMRVEHWHSQKKHATLVLDYSNMLAACTGSEGKNVPQNQTHCDVFRKHKDLSHNPSNPTHRVQEKIRYNNDGTIYSDDTSLNNDINHVLNLNPKHEGARLIMNRKAIKSAINTVFSKISLTKNQINNKLIKYCSKNKDGYYNEYSGVAIYFLQKRLTTL